MTKHTKRQLDVLLICLIGSNAALFLFLAYIGKLSTDPKQLVFIDFWGRLCVYSLWFTGYALYRKYLSDKPLIRNIVITLVLFNIPLFLLLGYFDKLSTAAKDLPFIDFWGRITVYSLWFIAYEAYRKYVVVTQPEITQSAH